MLPAAAGLLHALELDDRLAIGEDRLQLVVLRGRQIALRQHDLIVRRHADAELAVLGVELLLRQIARGLRRLHALGRVLHLDRGVADVARHLQVELPKLHFDLVLLNARPRDRRIGRARAEVVADVQRRCSTSAAGCGTACPARRDSRPGSMPMISPRLTPSPSVMNRVPPMPVVA